MSARIHPTAIVDPTATIAPDAEVGPWAIVGPNCHLGAGSVLQARAVLEENVTVGAHVTIGIGSVLGGKPQDLKWKGEQTFVEIGDHTTIREYATINRATSQSWKTTVGQHCFIMSYVHLAHDCHVGDHVIMSNGTQLAGHVTIEEWAIISGLCAVHQFAKVGRHSFIGGMSRVAKDVPPFVKAVGNPIKLYGLNSVGLQRRGFSEEVVSELKKAYRLFFRSELNVRQALDQARQELQPSAEVQALIDFIETSGRGTTI
ncbi:MAG: acyl-ACP--UDP-N-acetylglucosamine O-acyltransferase [Gemmatimonadetes bacterium]|nr:acyl-ACP--UDP-N-acetylglucosamine O-acyltransferase [Gemmatimonadota bacterium]MBI3566884.1 acyl-ACP--UDP-N-acetylglucosamine O-acyltransferase [Gemmatimonadota bacterium]